MRTATIRDLRTRFPELKRALEEEGEIIVTDRGRPAFVLRAYSRPAASATDRLDYFARLRSRQARPISARASRAIDEGNRGER